MSGRNHGKRNPASLWITPSLHTYTYTSTYTSKVPAALAGGIGGCF